MPITIKTREMAVKNPETGQYDLFDAIAINNTADRVAEINQAGAAQVSAIETKGEETLDSIPETYTELSDQVDDNTAAIDALTDSTQYAVRADESQSLTDTQKSTARSNIGLAFTETASGEIVIS